MSAFVEQLNMIVNFMFNCIVSIANIVMSSYILMLVVAIWVVDRVAKLFKLI